jgi:hypothetical protein
MITYAGLFLLSAATLTFEVNLTRIFSIAQFYHFAFMIVSLALLGFALVAHSSPFGQSLSRAKPRGSDHRQSNVPGM